MLLKCAVGMAIEPNSADHVLLIKDDVEPVCNAVYDAQSQVTVLHELLAELPARMPRHITWAY